MPWMTVSFSLSVLAAQAQNRTALPASAIFTRSISGWMSGDLEGLALHERSGRWRRWRRRVHLHPLGPLIPVEGVFADAALGERNVPLPRRRACASKRPAPSSLITRVSPRVLNSKCSLSAESSKRLFNVRAAARRVDGTAHALLTQILEQLQRVASSQKPSRVVSSEAPCTRRSSIVSRRWYHIVLSVLRWVTVAGTCRRSRPSSTLRPIDLVLDVGEDDLGEQGRRRSQRAPRSSKSTGTPQTMQPAEDAAVPRSASRAARRKRERRPHHRRRASPSPSAQRPARSPAARWCARYRRARSSRPVTASTSSSIRPSTSCSAVVEHTRRLDHADHVDARAHVRHVARPTILSHTRHMCSGNGAAASHSSKWRPTSGHRRSRARLLVPFAFSSCSPPPTR